ncbi:MAG: hypothetical protein Marn2KO_10190 [Marinobacter nauticus]
MPALGWGWPPKNRYKHFHVRFSPAIHGLRHFWEATPNPELLARGFFRHRVGVKQSQLAESR